MRAILGETFRLLGGHLYLFTLLSLTVWLPVHVLLNYLEFFDPGEDAVGRALRIVLTAQVVLDPLVVSAMLSALASQAAVAIENGKFFVATVQKNMELLQTKQQLEKKVEELDVLMEIARVSASARRSSRARR